jgi:thioester reductase-like protein
MTKADPGSAKEPGPKAVKAKKTTAKRRPRAKKASIGHAFITGYPGFIGKRLTRRILRQFPRAKITVLVQEKFFEEASAIVDGMPPRQADRITVLMGDVAKLDLGLSGLEVESLKTSITHLFHLAAVQYLGVGSGEMQRVNVGGTRNVLTLAREFSNLERLVHFSSCYVSGDRIGVITEDELDVGQGFRNAYEESKFQAEILARRAMRDLPVTVVRPSIVVGDSKTGAIDRFDGIYGLGIFVVTSPIRVPIPLPGDCTAPLNLIPVDYLTKAVLALALDKRSAGKTYHLVDPNPLSSRHVYNFIAEKTGRKPSRISVNYALARRVLRLPFIERFSRPHAQAIDYLNHLAIYNSANTLSHLEGTGVLCPRFDTYGERLVTFVARSLALQQGPRQILRGRKDAPVLDLPQPNDSDEAH